jgi:hypothetical protein
MREPVRFCVVLSCREIPQLVREKFPLESALSWISTGGVDSCSSIASSDGSSIQVLHETMSGLQDAHRIVHIPPLSASPSRLELRPAPVVTNLSLPASPALSPARDALQQTVGSLKGSVDALSQTCEILSQRVAALETVMLQERAARAAVDSKRVCCRIC